MGKGLCSRCIIKVDISTLSVLGETQERVKLVLENSVIWGTLGGRVCSSLVPLKCIWQEDPWVPGNSSNMNNTIF